MLEQVKEEGSDDGETGVDMETGRRLRPRVRVRVRVRSIEPVRWRGRMDEEVSRMVRRLNGYQHRQTRHVCCLLDC